MFLLYFRLFTFSDLYWVCLSVFSCTVLFVSISQVIGCEDHLRNDLYCVEWGVKLYSIHPSIGWNSLPFPPRLGGWASNTHTRLTALCPGLPGWSGTRKVKFCEWRWHQLGHMQVCTSLQTDNHASTLPLSFLQARCPSCRPTNSVKALKAAIIIFDLGYHCNYLCLYSPAS